MKKPAAEYIRMSTDKQEHSPETQRAVIREKLPKDLEIVATYEDRAISGDSMERRPGLMQLLLDAEARKFDVVVFYRYDRAFRNAEEQAVTINRLRRMGLTVHSILDPPGEGAAGNLIVGILGVVNQFERELTGERIYHANRQLAKAGRWTGARRTPLGYDYDSENKRLVVNQAEAEVVKEVFRAYIECRSAYGAAKKLRQKGLVTKYGNPWGVPAVRDIVSNEIYLGKIRWGRRRAVAGKKYRERNKDYEVFEGQHEAIIDERTWYEAQRIAADRRMAPRSSAASPHLLTGLGRCLVCGATIVSAKDSRYRCQSVVTGRDCTHWTKKASWLENTVYALVLANIDGSDFSERMRSIEVSQKDAQALEKELARLNAQLERQMAAYEAGAYTLEQFRERKAQVEAEKLSLLRQIEASRVSFSEEDLRAVQSFATLWERLDIPHRQAALRAVIERYECDGTLCRVHFRDLGILGWRRMIESPVLRDDYFGYWLKTRQEAAADKG